MQIIGPHPRFTEAETQCLNKHSKGFWCMPKCETHSLRGLKKAASRIQEPELKNQTVSPEGAKETHHSSVDQSFQSMIEPAGQKWWWVMKRENSGFRGVVSRGQPLPLCLPASLNLFPEALFLKTAKGKLIRVLR